MKMTLAFPTTGPAEAHDDEDAPGGNIERDVLKSEDVVGGGHQLGLAHAAPNRLQCAGGMGSEDLVDVLDADFAVLRHRSALLLSRCLQALTIALPDAVEEVLHLVASGEAAIGIAGTPPGKLPPTFEPLFEDHFRLVCVTDNPHTDAPRQLRWDDLRDHELIVNEAAQVIDAPEYARQVERARFTVRNMTSLLAMVDAQSGVTLLPALACTTLPAGLTAPAMESGGVRRVVGIVPRQNSAPNPLARAFITHLRAQTDAALAGNIGHRF